MSFNWPDAIDDIASYNTICLTSTDEKTNNAIPFILYPNPSSGTYFFSDFINIKTVEVFNLLGEQLLTLGHTKQINLSSFPQGFYTVHINGIEIIKLVKE